MAELFSDLCMFVLKYSETLECVLIEIKEPYLTLLYNPEMENLRHSQNVLNFKTNMLHMAPVTNGFDL